MSGPEDCSERVREQEGREKDRARRLNSTPTVVRDTKKALPPF